MVTRAGPAAATDRADARVQVLKTYRYLRLAMVVLAVVLGTSVVVESIHSGVVLDSISAYYFTPARGVFVSTLVAIGVGLIALQGGSRLEDAVLNLAGMFAPVVAFVPIAQDRPPGFPLSATEPYVENNLAALLVGAVAAVVLVAITAATQPDEEGQRRRMLGSDRIGVLLGIGVVAVSMLWYVGAHDSFISWADPVAAVSMFAMIAVAVLVNTRAGHHRRSYAAIFAAMLLTQLVWLSAPFWDHAVLVVEAALITLFAVFWSLQTWDLRYAEVVGRPATGSSAA